MIENLFLGGGGGASLDVTGYATIEERPLSAEDNEIVIITGMGIGKVTVDAVAPNTPSAGDVWIELAALSDATIKVGDDNQVVMIPLGMASQWDGTGWGSVDGYAYFDGAWVEFSTDVPDGQIAYENNTNTWLQCAMIPPSSVGNPTLEEIVDNADICTVLMNSYNAVNYMIRSSVIQAAVLASGTAIAALDASNPFVSAVMVSDNEPMGYVASASSFYPGYNPYKLTEESSIEYSVSKSWCNMGGNSTDWCAIQIPNAIWPYAISLRAGAGINLREITLRIEASSNGIDWVPITNDTVVGNAVSKLYTLPNVNLYAKYRVYIPNTAAVYCYANNLKVFGKTMEV